MPEFSSPENRTSSRIWESFVIDGTLEVETVFFDLGAGALAAIADDTPNDGAVIKTEVTVSAGDTLTFSFNFLDGEQPQGDIVNDVAFLVVGDEVIKLADIFTANLDSDVLIPNPVEGDPTFEQSGYTEFTFTFLEGGTVDIGFGIMNVEDQFLDSGLLLDNVTLTIAAAV